MTTVQLPHVLSELAQIALDDVIKVEVLPGYRIGMASWHAVDSFSAGCTVCAAGAVMDRTLGLERETNLDSVHDILKRFGAHNGAALLAIDALRRGAVGEALTILGSEDPEASWYADEEACGDDEDEDELRIPRHALSRELPQYTEDGWHDAMRELIADLRKAGL